jgi:hypothetical protein
MLGQTYPLYLFRVINRYVGNLPPMPGVFQDYPAPVIRDTEGDREMVTMRWGRRRAHRERRLRTSAYVIASLAHVAEALAARSIHLEHRCSYD